jgi:N-methylhydantoinase B
MTTDSLTARLDPVTLSVMASALTGIAEEMGTVLIRSSYSSNIKERRDCSTALFDARGRMVAQAEHIPVHLGAMPEAVAAVMARDPGPGDVFVINDPFSGGTHLPDITLVSTIAPYGDIIGYGVTRAHHSDVGGIRPGSMAAGTTEIYQEGLIIPPVRLTDEVLELIRANTRTPAIRGGDILAQLAANRVAEARLRDLCERRGLEIVLAAFDELLAYGERRAREAIRALPNGRYETTSFMEGDGRTDEDIAIRVAVTVNDDQLVVDFAGSSDAVEGNVNCPLAVTRSACYFAFKVLLGEDVPGNAGAYVPIHVVAPVGSFVNAQKPSAVAAGNMETSQRVADTVLLALSQVANVPAQGQGTHNVVTIGGSHWTYVETLGGGQGASSSGPGSSGVHVGTTNTLNTPIEALELEFPLRVERYELLRGSGGAGRFRGGDGLVRSLRVLEPAFLSLLTERRRHAPQGLRGGAAGRPGRNLVNADQLPSKATRELRPGDVVTIETPGGGGWGVAGSDG